MPAIQPARLRQQAGVLVEQFDDPPAFIRSLHALFEFYADRARRPGQAGTPVPLIQAYKVRPQVLRMLLLEMQPLANQNADKTLAICDALWQETYLEFRLLATMLLGQLSPNPVEPVLARVQSWITADLEFYLIEAVFNYGLERVRREQPQTLLRMIQSWLDDPKSLRQQLGLRALLPLIRNPEFENLPVFFRMVAPFCRTAPSGLRPDILDVVAALAQRSPTETAHFLRQMLSFVEAPDAPWLVRQSLSSFPPEMQDSLRQAARGVEAHPAEKRR
jgi:hypothetical protein